jgi:hypothetical protein
MRSSVWLTPWQITGIWGLFQKRELKHPIFVNKPLLQGVFLANSVGLRKTYIAVRYLLEVSLEVIGKGFQ